MKSKLCNKLKIFVIATLVILVAGMALIGTLGFNQNYGYKPSYEVQVSVDQNAGDSVDVLKKATAKAFASNGVTPVSYTIQEGNDGTIIYYQFSSDVTSKKASIQSTIQAQLDLDASVSNLVATVKVYEYHGSTDKQVVNTLIAIAVAVVIAFVYAIFLTKIKGAVATLATMVLSALLGIAIIGLTRIPVAPYLAMFIGVATLVGGVTAIALMSKIKAIEKASTTKLSKAEVIEKVIKSSKCTLLCAGGAIVALSALIAIFGGVSALFAGLGVLACGIAGLFSATFFAPIVWSAIKTR